MSVNSLDTGGCYPPSNNHGRAQWGIIENNFLLHTWGLAKLLEGSSGVYRFAVFAMRFDLSTSRTHAKIPRYACNLALEESRPLRAPKAKRC